MSFRCQDLLNLFPSPTVELLGGEEGLSRIVRWAYVAEATETIFYSLNWLSGNELVIITGCNITGELGPVIEEFVHTCAKKNVAGIVVNTGRYIPQVPQQAIDAADRLGIPLMSTPWETRLVEFTKDICTAIIDRDVENESMHALADNLLFGQGPPAENTLMMLAKYDFETASGYFVAILLPDASATQTAQNRAELCTYLVDTARAVFERGQQKILITRIGDNVVAIFKTTAQGEPQKKLLSDIADTMRRHHPKQTLKIGVGKVCRTLSEIPDGYQTAQQVMRIHQCEHMGSVAYYNAIGVYMLLLSIKDKDVLRSYYADIFGPVLEYDKSNGAALMHTLETYMDHDARLGPTSKELYVHENTLKYRLNKIRALLDVDIGLPEVQSRISIGLKVGRILGETRYT